MRIALNALFVGRGVAGGKVYRDGLLHGFAEIAGAEEQFDVFTRSPPDLPTFPTERIRAVPAPVSDSSTIRRTYWEYRCLPLAVQSGGYAVYHALGSLSPRVRGVPTVLTVHDLIYRHFPEGTPFALRLFMHAVQPGAARRADRVIVVSQYGAREVMEHLRVPEERIRVIPHGPGHGFAPVERPELARDALARLGIRQPYIVAVGRGYPHKNIHGLLRAFAILHSEHPDLGLVLIGDRYRTADPLLKLARELNLEDAVIWTGYLPSPDLNAVYSCAELFAFPSLAEGFGLPVLEAMACGAPVVASNRTAIPEVVGDAGILADANRPDEFAGAIRRVLNDGGLRSELKARGFTRVAEFTWERCAAETLAVYRELV